MLALLSGVVGVVLGALVVWALSLKRSQTLRDGVARAQQDLAVRDSQFAIANEGLARERAEHEAALRNMEVTFENMSNRVLAQTVEQFSHNQEQVLKERDSKLNLTLKPLEALLDEYKKNLAEFNKEHTGALSDVKNRANELLDAQQRTQDETRRLNQLLGRGDQRGHWGEVQLANVMEASGLRRNIDYDLQVTGFNETGRTLRPDCVVRMPNSASIAIDAKFPFDAFEAALATDDAEQRRTSYEAHALALRGHVKTLKEKGLRSKVKVIAGIRGLCRTERLRDHRRVRSRPRTTWLRRQGESPDRRTHQSPVVAVVRGDGAAPARGEDQRQGDPRSRRDHL